MLMTLVLMALQALEATQNIMVVQNLGVMVDIIVWKDICKKSFLVQCSQVSVEQSDHHQKQEEKQCSLSNWLSLRKPVKIIFITVKQDSQFFTLHFNILAFGTWSISLMVDYRKWRI